MANEDFCDLSIPLSMCAQEALQIVFALLMSDKYPQAGTCIGAGSMFESLARVLPRGLQTLGIHRELSYLAYFSIGCEPSVARGLLGVIALRHLRRVERWRILRANLFLGARALGIP